MIRSLLELFGICTHQRYTFPQTPRRMGKLNRFHRRGKCHVTCLACGAELEYDWGAMKVGKRIHPPSQHRMQLVEPSSPTLDREVG